MLHDVPPVRSVSAINAPPTGPSEGDENPQQFLAIPPLLDPKSPNLQPYVKFQTIQRE